MKILGITIERGAGKDSAPLEAKTKQPATLILAVAEHMKNHSTWALKIQHVNRDTLKAAPILTTTIGEFVQVCDHVEEFIRERFGAGEFRVAIYRPNGELVSSYDVPVGGPKAYKGSGAGIIAKQDGEKKKKSTPVDDFVALAGAMKVLQPEADTGMKDLMVELVKGQLQGGASESDIFMREIASVSVNNAIGEKETEFDRMKSMIELTRMLAPNIPEENIATALIGALPGIAQVFAMSKGGNAPQQVTMPQAAPALPPATAGVDMNALKSLAATIPAEMIQQLPADQQRAVQQLLSAGAPAAQGATPGVTLPRPGAPIDETAGSAAVGTSPIAATAPPAAGVNPHHAAIDAMVEEIRVDLRGTATDNQIAEKMLAMVTAARGFTSSAPHPLLKGIMEATEANGAAEFKRFCQAIPELGYDYERIDRIGTEIKLVMERGATATIDALEDEQEQAEAMPATDDLEFAYETEAEMERANAEESNHDVLRSSGVSKAGPEIEPGTDQDRENSEGPREEDEYQAEAV